MKQTCSKLELFLEFRTEEMADAQYIYWSTCDAIRHDEADKAFTTAQSKIKNVADSIDTMRSIGLLTNYEANYYYDLYMHYYFLTMKEEFEVYEQKEGNHEAD